MDQLFDRMDTVFLLVSDFEKVFEWYHETLGLPVVWRTDMIATLKAGDKTPITLVKKEAVADSHPLFNLYAPDIRKAHETLQQRGVSVGPIRDYGTVQMFDFTDIEGRVLNVCHF
jgi:catechol-2,3-dioxygenase